MEGVLSSPVAERVAESRRSEEVEREKGGEIERAPKTWQDNAMPLCSTSRQLTSFSSLGFHDSFAFGAPRVIGHLIGIWMVSYADRVIVTGMNSNSCISALLDGSDLGRQTSVLFVHKN